MTKFEQLIPVNVDSPDRITVSARDLHTALEVKTLFKDWFPRMLEYGFENGRDFNPLKIEQVRLEGSREVTRTVDDAEITIEMAKEIYMLQRSEKGKRDGEEFVMLIEAESEAAAKLLLPDTVELVEKTEKSS